MGLILPIKRKGIVIWILNLLSLLFMQSRQYFKGIDFKKLQNGIPNNSKAKHCAHSIDYQNEPTVTYIQNMISEFAENN